MNLNIWDKFILLSRPNLDWIARFAIFICYFWFGLLKVLGLSPADELVSDLLKRTIAFIEPDTFIFLFGILECIIGLLFLKRGWEKIVIPLFAIHLFMTFGPLIMLPTTTWSGFGAPTLEGQYIIKNFALIGCVMAIAAKLTIRNET